MLLPSSDISSIEQPMYVLREPIELGERRFNVFDQDTFDEINDTFQDSNEFSTTHLIESFHCTFYKETPLNIFKETLVYFPKNSIQWSSNFYFYSIEHNMYIYPEPNSFYYTPFDLTLVCEDVNQCKVHVILAKKNSND
jgi:hypothetical protein